MVDSPKLLLPYLAASQAQKHVTHNEALRLLDGLVQLAVEDRDITAPPGSPGDGDCWIVASGATGAWAGWDDDIAMWSDGSWYRLAARTGFRAWVKDEAQLVVLASGGWAALGAGGPSPEVDVAIGPAGGTTGLAVAEELLSGLSGASVDSSVVIPDRTIVLGVSTRTVTAITGATSYGCGIAGQTTKFGGSLGVAAGSTNAGVIGPEAFYADTPIRLTADGSDFTGGAVRLAIHYATVGIPSS